MNNFLLKNYDDLLIQKNYSPNTKKTHLNYFKDFLKYFKTLNVDKLTIVLARRYE